MVQHSKLAEAHDDFWHPPSVPFEESLWRSLGFRERVRLWMKQLDKKAPVPIVAALLYAFKLPLWFAVFNYIFRNRRLPFSADLNVKRWIVYNVLHDVLGLGATSGPLGFKFNLKVPCEAWWYFLTPGTLTFPLVPRVGGVRTRSTVALYMGYIMSLMRALVAPKIGLREIGPALAFLLSLAPFDVLPFFASRGEHYVYQMICLCFGGQQWRFGCQMVQVALWTGAGLSKVGPWFKYVVGFMVPNCVFLRDHIPQVRKMIMKDPPHDTRPSSLGIVLAHAGTATEIVMGILCAWERTRKAGLFAMTGFHFFIISQTPIASVFEWNIYSILMGWYLFGYGKGVKVGEISYRLIAFLVCALVVVPVYGQLCPEKVPFLMAYRPYAGNWRWMWCLITKSALPRLHRLRTFDDTPLPGRKAIPLFGSEPRYEEHIDYVSTASLMLFPSYRALPGIVDNLNDRYGRKIDDVHVIPHVPFENYVVGWSLGIGWGMFRESFRASMQSVCAFDAGECIFIQFEPLGLMRRDVHWRAVDVSTGEILMSGHNQYSELEQLQDPLGLLIHP